VRGELKRSCDPSGLKRGAVSGVKLSAPVTTATGFVPSAFIIQIFEVPLRRLAKAIVAPSGLSDGLKSSAALLVRRTMFVPSMFSL